MKKNSSKILLSFLLSFVLLTSLIITNVYISIPTQISLSQGDTYSKSLSSFVNTTSDEESASQNVSGISQKKLVYNENDTVFFNTDNPGVYDVSLSLFGIIPLKEVSVQVNKSIQLEVGGNLIGIKMSTDGVLVIGISYVIDEASIKRSPMEEAGIIEGDRIIKMNDKEIDSTNDLVKMVESAGTNPINLEYIRGTVVSKTKILPIKSASGEIKIGAWVRDSTAGIGTMTFYNPANNTFGALGHAITDIDTGELLKIKDGDLLKCEVTSICKSEKGTPGEIVGHFNSANVIGEIKDNSTTGIFGKMGHYKIDETKLMDVGSKFSVVQGPATILCSLDGKTVNEYDILIEKASAAGEKTKGMVIEIVDPELIAVTGGIVQGMSGSPIIQNGRIIGAVTHVFVNNPTKGYGIYIESMLDDCEIACNN